MIIAEKEIEEYWGDENNSASMKVTIRYPIYNKD